MQCVLSTFLCAIGIYIFINCQIGADTIDVFIDGIHKKMNMSIALSDQIYTCVIFGFAFILSRKRIGILSIVNTLLIGICIATIEPIISQFDLSNSTYFVKIIALLFAQLCFGISYGLLQTLKLGMNTTDALLFYFVDKLNIDYMKIRLVFDVIITLLGISLGGVVGIGTILSVTTTGILVSYFANIFNKMKSKLLGFNREV